MAGMSHRYDAATKYLIDTRLADWLPLSGRTIRAAVEVINADVATVSAVQERDLPAVIQRMQERIEREANPADAGVLWTATDVLMGLRYSEALVEQLLRGVRRMKESVTYQAILREGRVEGRLETLRSTVLDLGTERFGPADDEVVATITAMTDASELQSLVRRILHVSGWSELLGKW